VTKTILIVHDLRLATLVLRALRSTWGTLNRTFSLESNAAQLTITWRVAVTSNRPDEPLNPIRDWALGYVAALVGHCETVC
jgi:hypothetical protein